MGEILVRRSLIILAPVDVGIIRLHRSPVDVETVHICKSPVDVRAVCIQEIHNVNTIHVHRSMLIGVRIPRKSNGPVTLQ